MSEKQKKVSTLERQRGPSHRRQSFSNHSRAADANPHRINHHMTVRIMGTNRRNNHRHFWVKANPATVTRPQATMIKNPLDTTREDTTSRYKSKTKKRREWSSILTHLHRRSTLRDLQEKTKTIEANTLKAESVCLQFSQPRWSSRKTIPNRWFGFLRTKPKWNCDWASLTTPQISTARGKKGKTEQR